MNNIGLRDWFAGQALVRLGDEPHEAAKRAYAFADAMLSARGTGDRTHGEDTEPTDEVDQVKLPVGWTIIRRDSRLIVVSSIGNDEVTVSPVFGEITINDGDSASVDIDAVVTALRLVGYRIQEPK